MHINIDYYINADRERLTLSLSSDAQADLKQEISDAEFPHTDHFLWQVLERLLCNSELEWVTPEETGDLTDAPMLGLRDGAGKVIERWAYLDYQIKSLVHELAEHGIVTLVS